MKPLGHLRKKVIIQAIKEILNHTKSFEGNRKDAVLKVIL